MYGTGNAPKRFICPKYAEQPEKTMLIVVYSAFDDKPSNDYYLAQSWNHRIEYEKNSRLNELYDALITLGYKMSNDEKALRDGTHELFECKEESSKQAG
jgi:ParB family chromosome partitioning protein